MRNIMYRILRLGMVSLLFTGMVDAQVLKYTDARNLLMVGKAGSSKE